MVLILEAMLKYVTYDFTRTIANRGESRKV